MGVLHHFITPSSFLLATDAQDSPIKLTDFALAHFFKVGTRIPCKPLPAQYSWERAVVLCAGTRGAQLYTPSGAHACLRSLMSWHPG